MMTAMRKLRLRDRIGAPADPSDILIETKKIRDGSAALSIDAFSRDFDFVVTVFGKNDYILEHRSKNPDEAERIYVGIRHVDDAHGSGWMNVGL
jgi:hypothetical protein